MASSGKFATLLTVLLACAAPTAATAEDNARGEELYDLCRQCHGPTGGGDPLALAPAIAGLGKWYVSAQLQNFRDGKRGVHPDDVGGLRMYPMSLSLRSDEDIEDVSAYVASLPQHSPAPTLEGGDAKAGAALYAVCKACHGPDGAGNEALNAPRLSGTSDWYMLKTLEKYKAGIRGGAGASPNSVMMRGMAMSLANEQAMRDVIAYIETLAN